MKASGRAAAKGSRGDDGEALSGHSGERRGETSGRLTRTRWQTGNPRCASPTNKAGGSMLIAFYLYSAPTLVMRETTCELSFVEWYREAENGRGRPSCVSCPPKAAA